MSLSILVIKTSLYILEKVSLFRVARIALPVNDPLYGKDGPLIKNWNLE